MCYLRSNYLRRAQLAQPCPSAHCIVSQMLRCRSRFAVEKELIDKALKQGDKRVNLRPISDICFSIILNEYLVLKLLGWRLGVYLLFIFTVFIYLFFETAKCFSEVVYVQKLQVIHFRPVFDFCVFSFTHFALQVLVSSYSLICSIFNV